MFVLLSAVRVWLFPLSGFVMWLLGFSGLFEDPDFYDFPDSLEFPDSLNFPDFLDFLEFPDFLDFPDILDFPDFWIFWIFWIFLIFIFSLAQGSGRSVLVSFHPLLPPRKSVFLDLQFDSR